MVLSEVREGGDFLGVQLRGQVTERADTVGGGKGPQDNPAVRALGQDPGHQPAVEELGLRAPSRAADGRVQREHLPQVATVKAQLAAVSLVVRPAESPSYMRSVAVRELADLCDPDHRLDPEGPLAANLAIPDSLPVFLVGPVALGIAPVPGSFLAAA